MDWQLIFLAAGAIGSFAGSYCANKVELKWLRRDIDLANDRIDLAHKRIDTIALK